ncbi:LysR substrate-binding domain-containing protein [Burkholderia stagnalis]
MTERLRLSFSALRALEAAARRRSFTLAAQELHLTHSAISHQIRQVESLLGTSLFTRLQSEMMPTPTCLRLAERIRHNLADMELALLEAKDAGKPRRQVLEVCVMADFANVWLIPRLDAFSERYPHLDLSITLHNALDTPERHDTDIGIWHRRVDKRGFQSKKLLEDQVIAVCTQAFFRRHGPLTVADLVRVPLLRFAGRSWREFFHASGIDAGDPPHGPTFSDAASLLQAALAGQGVAMLRERLIRSRLLDRTLIRIGETRIPSNLDYYLCWKEDNPKVDAIRQFSEWLAEAIDQAG